MFANLTGWHALIVLVVIVLLFGATKLPVLARSVGQSMKIFRQEVKPGLDELEQPVDSELNPKVADGATR
ncbi:MAG: twin-arginine translocase TatA/TatE family subunit [Micrococcales bacterium]|nr:twin-arginine translocase TatA/TatE family subunit [Micrococcales bacterium]